MKKKGEIRSFAARRIPKPRFPFIISAHDRRWTASPEDLPRGNKALDDFLRALKNIFEQNVENGAKISKLLKNVVFLESALDELLDRNHVDRVAANRADPGIQAFFSELIPVLDNLERLKQAVIETGQEEWRRGMTIFHEKMMEVLNTHGFHTSAVTGMAFNPAHHESVSVEYNSHMPSGSISEIIESGWLYKDSVLRYAKVTVAKGND